MVEGGGMRGVFSAGVLDAFLTAEFDPFNLYIGTSAGACNLSSHVAGQLERNIRMYTGLMCRREFISLKRFLMGGHFMDVDWFWDAAAQEDPLDVAACARNTRDKEFVVVCTSVETGRPVYFRPSQETWSDTIKASSALPVLFKRPLFIESQRVVDGGVADAIPVEEAHRRGATRMVVVRSQMDGYVKKNGMEAWISGLLSRKHPRLRETMRSKAETYMRSLGFIADPPDGVEVMQIAPERALKSGRTSQKLPLLQEDYQLGKSQGMVFMEAWRE